MNAPSPIATSTNLGLRIPAVLVPSCQLANRFSASAPPQEQLGHPRIPAAFIGHAAAAGRRWLHGPRVFALHGAAAGGTATYSGLESRGVLGFEGFLGGRKQLGQVEG